MQIISVRFAQSIDYMRIRGNSIDAIADVIVTDCKANYINERVKLPIADDVLKNAFTSALLAFDRDTDKIIATQIIKRFTGDVLYLDSLFDFSIGVLKTRWDEVVHLANENAPYLSVQSTFMELLQFLISNIDCNIDETMFMHIRENAVRDNVKKLFLQ